MKGFIEVHCDKKPMLINVNSIRVVLLKHILKDNKRDCILGMCDEFMDIARQEDIIPDESYDEVKHMIEEATK